MEDVLAIVYLSIFVVFVTSIVALFRPLPRVWLPGKKRAGVVAAVSFVLMAFTANLFPEEGHKPAQEEAKEKEEPTVRAKQKTLQERRREVDERRRAKWRALYEKDMQDPTMRKILVSCKQDYQCWGQRHLLEANEACRVHVARQYLTVDYIWKTKHWNMFSVWRWERGSKSVLVYWGDNIRFPTKFGHYVDHVYRCHFDTESREVVNFETTPG